MIVRGVLELLGSRMCCQVRHLSLSRGLSMDPIAQGLAAV